MVKRVWLPEISRADLYWEMGGTGGPAGGTGGSEGAAATAGAAG
jgi:hypothetical protein